MARILQAVSQVIAERGAERAGINAVAEKAGVNKVLIYRYFGNWEGLMEQFTKEGQFLSAYNDAFLSASADLTGADPTQAWTNYMVGMMRELRSRKPSQELLKWELSNPYSDLTQNLMLLRNDSYKRLIAQLKTNPNYDAAAITALLSSGIAFVVLLSTYQDTLIDLNMKTEEGWQRLENAVEQIYRGLNRLPAEEKE